MVISLLLLSSLMISPPNETKIVPAHILAGVTHHWGATASGFASNASNWVEGTAPVAGDDVIFAQGENCTWDITDTVFGTFDMTSTYAHHVAISTNIYTSGSVHIQGGLLSGGSDYWYSQNDFIVTSSNHLAADSVLLNESSSSGHTIDIPYDLVSGNGTLHALQISQNTYISNLAVRYGVAISAVVTVTGNFIMYLESSTPYSNAGSIIGSGNLTFLWTFASNRSMTFGNITCPTTFNTIAPGGSATWVRLGANTTFGSSLSINSTYNYPLIVWGDASNYGLTVRGLLTLGNYGQIIQSSSFYNLTGGIEISGNSSIYSGFSADGYLNTSNLIMRHGLFNATGGQVRVTSVQNHYTLKSVILPVYSISRIPLNPRLLGLNYTIAVNNSYSFEPFYFCNGNYPGYLVLGVLDPDGAIIERYPDGKLWYNPYFIGRYACEIYANWLMTGNSTSLAHFFAQVNWIKAHEEIFGNHSIWYFNQTLGDRSPNPSWSALGSTFIIAALIDAYTIDHNPTYLMSAWRGLKAYDSSLVDHGLLTIWNGTVWYEEEAGNNSLVVNDPSHILNGFIDALGAPTYIHDFNGSALAKTIFDNGVAALKYHYGDFDTGMWQKYSILNEHASTDYISGIHAPGFDWIADYTKDSQLMAFKNCTDWIVGLAASGMTVSKITASNTVDLSNHNVSGLVDKHLHNAHYWSGYTPVSLLFDLGSVKNVNFFGYYVNSIISSPRNLTLDISEDNITWIREEIVFNSLEYDKCFVFNPSIEVRYFRMNITTAVKWPIVGIDEIIIGNFSAVNRSQAETAIYYYFNSTQNYQLLPNLIASRNMIIVDSKPYAVPVPGYVQNVSMVIKSTSQVNLYISAWNLSKDSGVVGKWVYYSAAVDDTLNYAITGLKKNWTYGILVNSTLIYKLDTNTSGSMVFNLSREAGSYEIEMIATGHAPILINGNAGFLGPNATTGITTGSGTPSDPYVIEGWDIDASAANGIVIENTTVYFIIRDCHIDGNSSNLGIYLLNCINGTLNNNTFSNSTYGIYLESSSSNIISCNHVRDNTLQGIYIDSGSSNRIWNNTFTRNNGAGSSYSLSNIQGYDGGTNNWWNFSGYGNFWSDWTTPDNASPWGIVDNPYSISGGMGAKDYNPLTFPSSIDNSPPHTNISISGTFGNSGWYISNVMIFLNASDSVSGVKRIEHSIDSGPWSAYNGPISIVSEGQHTFSYYSIDVAGNAELVNSTTFKIDMTPPSGSISIDAGAAYTNTTAVILNLTASDPTSGLLLMRLSNDNLTWDSWQTFSSSKNWTLTSIDGTKTVYYEVIDNAGNFKVYEAKIVFDATPPTLAFVMPNGFNFTSGSVTIKWMSLDYGEIDHFEYSLDGAPFASSGLSKQIDLVNLSAGSHNLTVHAIDGAGNAVEKKLQFNVVTAGSSMGGLMPLLLAITAIMAVMLLVSLLLRRKKEGKKEDEDKPVTWQGRLLSTLFRPLLRYHHGVRPKSRQERTPHSASIVARRKGR
jgi:parallel beta-helix repeat protein